MPIAIASNGTDRSTKQYEKSSSSTENTSKIFLKRLTLKTMHSTLFFSKLYYAIWSMAHSKLEGKFVQKVVFTVREMFKSCKHDKKVSGVTC